MPRKGQKQSRKRKASALAGPAEPAASVTLPTPISAMTDDTGYDHEPEDPVDGHDGDVDDDDEEAYDQDASDQPPSKSRGKAKGEGYQVLPVAELDDDWEGEAEDGATYLALALRENAKLPTSTRVADPYRVASPPPIAQRLNGDQPEAGPSRHPALPRESWVVSFSAHFQNYRKSIAARWPPSPRPPYPADQPPFPTFEHRHEWIYYISGYSRRRISNLNKHKPKRAFSPSRPTHDDEQVEAALQPSPEGTAPAAMDPDDEEEWMNAPQPINPEPLVHQPEAEGEIEQLEEETARHRPRYPTFSILSHLSNSQIISILIQISLHLSRHIDHLSSLLTLSLSETPPPESRGPHPLPNRVPTKYPNPFPAHLSQWSFALLSVLDEHLLPDDLHHLREFARVVMRVGGWRWIRAVQDGEVGARWALGQSREKGPPGQAGAGAVAVADTDESGVDETLTRCWMIVSAIAAGWAQHDLLESLETLFQ
ncbi:hypothetical protein DB88DRAFT_501463 [Papiliotrema laurentii]|uniref:Uncharacterized protein n=1 Tax=Papiliotrema laurentii TaxID=5418 RepID=A0AAD9FPT8_PAPLA|nr:hypothetical protein DB88DRAFT_501463 [Papiliotrema laurentii]